MNRNKIHTILFSAFILVAAATASRPAAAQDAKQPYPTMAPVEQYVMTKGLFPYGRPSERNLGAALVGSLRQHRVFRHSHVAGDSSPL